MADLFQIGMMLTVLAIGLNVGIYTSGLMIGMNYEGVLGSNGVLNQFMVSQFENISLDSNYSSITSSTTQLAESTQDVNVLLSETNTPLNIPMGSTIGDFIRLVWIILESAWIGWFLALFNLGLPAWIAFMITTPLTVIQAYTMYNLVRIFLGPLGNLFPRV